MADWTYPETWQVGDNLDANTLNRRVRDQTTTLLRRPLMVAHNASAFTLPTGSDTRLTFDTIDVDDDGMAMGGTPVTDFYVQREGTYQIWCNVEANGNGTAAPIFRVGLLLSATYRRWDVITKLHSNSGVGFTSSTNGTAILSVGERVGVVMYQNSGFNVTVAAINNAPRLVIMWLGIT
jgi:hypothetical protein